VSARRTGVHPVGDSIGASRSTWLLELSPGVAGHLAIAIHSHRSWAAGVPMRVPLELVELERVWSQAATGGQGRPAFDELRDLSERPAMSPRCLSYESVASALDVSVRTVRRLVSGGDLPSVRVGGSVRVRVSDLDSYVESLAEERM
jgi:excisionase family DNA binding protein